jgi:hypothetical protein
MGNNTAIAMTTTITLRTSHCIPLQPLVHPEPKARTCSPCTLYLWRKDFFHLGPGPVCPHPTYRSSNEP